MFALQSLRLRRRLSPLTSGSVRRRVRERRRAVQTRAEGERLAREGCDHRRQEKMEQQRLARDQLTSYEPWGRAGCGAPNTRGARFTNLRATGIYPEDELRVIRGVSQYEACRRWPSLSPRRGRRRRTRTPRLREDSQPRYAETLRRTVDNDIRCHASPAQQKNYKEVLDEMVEKKNKALKAETKYNMEYERKMQAMDGPWGRPGPGGGTWRNPRNIRFDFSKSMGWTDNAAFKKLLGDHRRQKLSSLTLPKVQKEDVTKENVSNSKENLNPSNIGKLPDIKNTNSAQASPEGSRKNSADKKEVKIDNSADKKDKAIKEVVSNSNNGKSKKNCSKKGRFVKRLLNGDRLKRIVPDDLVNGTACNGDGELDMKTTPEAAILRVTGGVELVPLLARRRRVGARTLPSSDITRPPDQSCQWRETIRVDYLTELKHQMQVKYERKQENRKDSAESVRQHHATWATLWGRPGHGAPQLRGRYARSNLARLLYVAPLISNQTSVV